LSYSPSKSGYTQKFALSGRNNRKTGQSRLLKNPTPGSCALEHAKIEAGYKTRTLDMANKEISFHKNIYAHWFSVNKGPYDLGYFRESTTKLGR
jgi:hypothetical protein